MNTVSLQYMQIAYNACTQLTTPYVCHQLIGPTVTQDTGFYSDQTSYLNMKVLRFASNEKI